MTGVRVPRFDAGFVIGLGTVFATVLEFAIETETETDFVQTVLPTLKPAVPSLPLQVCG